jgi:hypothetical protein
MRRKTKDRKFWSWEELEENKETKSKYEDGEKDNAMRGKIIEKK